VVRFFGRLHRNSAGRLGVWQGISGQYDGKSASRLRAKPSGGLYSVFPILPFDILKRKKELLCCLKQ
ncbi:MAG: hypothetical protein UDL61_00670, partial [Ruminococcus callidus]|uniref:hypothetical protein n=1 Tax=Ruminococcus callidus TaxID=40519 RepID=UPI002E79FCAA